MTSEPVLALAVAFAAAAGVLTVWNMLRQLTHRQDSLEFLSRQVVALFLSVVGMAFAVFAMTNAA